jgi:hypothetical protein
MNDEIERAFLATSRMILGTSLEGLEKHSKWLGRRVPLPEKTGSAISGKDVWIPTSPMYLGKRFDNARSVSLDEMDKLPNAALSYDDIRNSPVKDMINKHTEPVNYYCGNFRHWTWENVEKCSGAGDGRNMFYGDDTYRKVKNTAYTWYVLFSESIFGAFGLKDCSFCIHAYNSNRLSRCFEVDGSSNCSGLLFGHNCENVHDSIFCFNAKNLRYAVGNTVVGPVEFKRIKSILTDEITGSLRAEKHYDNDIFNIGCMGE